MTQHAHSKTNPRPHHHNLPHVRDAHLKEFPTRTNPALDSISIGSSVREATKSATAPLPLCPPPLAPKPPPQPPNSTTPFRSSLRYPILFILGRLCCPSTEDTIRPNKQTSRSKQHQRRSPARKEEPQAPPRPRPTDPIIEAASSVLGVGHKHRRKQRKR